MEEVRRSRMEPRAGASQGEMGFHEEETSRAMAQKLEIV